MDKGGGERKVLVGRFTGVLGVGNVLEEFEASKKCGFVLK